MTEKRFAYIKNSLITRYQSIPIQKIGKGKAFHCQGVVDELNKLWNENEDLKTDISVLNRHYDEYANVCDKLKKENKELKSVVKEVIELLSEEVDVFTDKATEHDLNAYIELNELDNKDAYYMTTATKEAIKMLKEIAK